MDLDLRKKEYIRRNRVPVFISERTPSKNRENLIELLDACGMDYLNRLEWLIRTDTRYAGDSLYVCRWEDEMVDYQNAMITGDQAAQLLGISRSTFMRRLREKKNMKKL